MMIDMLHFGTCEEVLDQYPDNFFHALVTDPPYGLGEIRGLTFLLDDWMKGGEGLDHQSKGFMARDWDKIPPPSTWREIYRVLRPGGYALVFASSRTWDMMSLSLRLAGFDNRDTIVCEGVPALYWFQGSGFPKGQDIGKAIDKLAGAERPVVGTINKTNSFSTTEPGWQRPFAFNEDGTPKHEMTITAPATDDAKRWHGWHTTLKGAHETILVFQKPLSESTIAKNVLRWETGGMNIGATRVSLQGEEDAADYADSFDYESRKRAQNPNQSPRFRGILANGRVGGVRKLPESGIAPGRWPTNLVLVHDPRCRLIGTTQDTLEAGTNTPIGIGGIYGKKRKRGDALPTEQVVGLWECVPECVVRIINEQSGIKQGKRSLRRKAGDTVYHGVYHHGEQYNSSEDVVGGYDDTGGAARFFPQFSYTEEDIAAAFRYVPKASPSERETGCELLPKRIADILDERPSGTFHERLASDKERGYVPRVRGNTHVTVKPIALMRWLVRLVCPVGGVVLDPFAGSGSTCMAAVTENAHYVGIEREEESFVIAQARVLWQIEKLAETAPKPLDNRGKV